MFYDEGSLFTLLAFLGIFAFIFFIVAVVLYILLSLGLYRLAVNKNLENPWLAWLPIGNLYILGMIIKDLKIDSFEIPSIQLVLPIGSLVVAAFRHLPFIGGLINLAYMILCLFAIFKLYKIYRPEKAVLWLILSIILPFMGPIFIFIIRNDLPAEH